MDFISQVFRSLYSAKVSVLIYLRSGYDFGYLIKLLTNNPLPNDENDFFDILRLWFPSIYDVKYIMRACKPLKGGLQDVADDLGVKSPFSPLLSINCSLSIVGHEDRICSSRVRFSANIGNLLQNARDLFW